MYNYCKEVSKIFIENEIYTVSTTSYALGEANHPTFATIIYDLHGIFYSRKTAMQLLNEACILLGGADYRGKIAAIRHNFGYLMKTPLIINHEKEIYAVPTKSPTRSDCRWVFPHHIKYYTIKNGTIYVVFDNGLVFPVNCSEYTLKQQLKRAAHCFLHYNNPPFNHNLKRNL